MLQHITIQEISARYRDVYDVIVSIHRNNYHNIFFIDPETADTQFPAIYFLSRTRLGVTWYVRGLRFVFEQDPKLLEEALKVAHEAVEGKHSYLAPALEETELLLGIKQPSNALF